MPFDAMAFQPASLTDYMAGIGVTPVPMEVLKDHKRRQVEKHPESLALRPVTYLVAGIFIGVGCTVRTVMVVGIPSGHLQMMALAMIAFLYTFLGMMVSFLGTTLIAHLFGITVRGKARWVESLLWRHRSIPPAIRDVIRRTDNSLPGTIIYGELVQNQVVLDPYIVVEMKGERVCLGIWEGSKIIAIAQMD